MSCIGIDIGTCNSCCFIIREAGATPEIVNTDMGGHLFPSVVAYTESDAVLAGEAAKQQQTCNPLNTYVEFKRIIGRSYKQRALWKNAKHWPFRLVPPDSDEPDGAPRYAAAYSGDILRLTATDLYTVLLSHVISVARTQLGESAIEQAVITVPAHFDTVQRHETMTAVQRAGIECPISILNEPTAATLAYLDINSKLLAGKVIVVFDLGAGTLDVTCVKPETDECKIIGSAGCSDLGGSDFDQRLLDMASAEYKSKTGSDLRTNKQRMVTVREQCERAKKTLSVNHEALISLGEAVDPLKVTRAQFERAIAPELSRCAATIANLLDRIHVAPESVPHVILCGGSSRVPGVHRAIKSVFPDATTLLTNINADECVARGACIHASGLCSTPEVDVSTPCIKVRDLLSQTIGIKTGRKQMLALLKRGAELPAVETQALLPMHREQSFADISIYQGESSTTDENQLLGTARLEGLRPGHPKVTLVLSANSNGIVSVDARDDENHVVTAQLQYTNE